MKRLRGNKTATIEKLTVTPNSIGEQVKTWTPTYNLIGWLDLMSQSKTSTELSSFIGDSTHVFVCDYHPMPDIDPDQSRLIVDGVTYEIQYVDNPMELDYHQEIYLRMSGWQ